METRITQRAQPFIDIAWFNFSDLAPGDYVVLPHLHHFHQLDVILDGQVEVQIEGLPDFTGQAQDAWLIPPLMRHAYQSTHGYRLGSYKLHLSSRYWPLFGNGFRKYTLSPTLMEELELAGQRYRNNAPLANHQISAVASLCLIECLYKTEASADPGDNMDPLRSVLWPLFERIERAPFDAWSVNRMASECFLSPNYFSGAFHRIIGKTPQRYLLETRMRASAAELFVEPAQPIKEIAERAGYSTVPAFSRAFKQVFDVGPAAYRTQHLQLP